MALSDLQSRIQSEIPSPVARSGYALERQEVQIVTYNGTCLTYFLKQNKGDPRQYRQFLRLNQIGRVFTDLESGNIVSINKMDTFAQHPDY